MCTHVCTCLFCRVGTSLRDDGVDGDDGLKDANLKKKPNIFYPKSTACGIE